MSSIWEVFYDLCMHIQLQHAAGVELRIVNEGVLGGHKVCEGEVLPTWRVGVTTLASEQTLDGSRLSDTLGSQR